MKATIAAVKPQPRYWEQGQIYFVDGAFGDDSEWSLGVKSEEKAQATIATLHDLIGKEDEYEVEPKPDRNGRKQWKLRSWPGKPAAPAFGGGNRGGREYIPRYRDTEQGTKEERLSICRSVALQEATSWLNRQEEPKPVVSNILNVAEEFYQWLIKPLPPIPAREASQPEGMQGSSSAPAALPAQSGDTPPAVRSFQKPHCPKCGVQESVFQEKDRQSGQYVTGSFYCWKQKGGCGHKWKDMGELAASVGAKTGDQIKSRLESALDEIAKARANKDVVYLKAIEDHASKRLDEGKLSIEGASAISQAITEALRVIASGQNQAQFHDRKVQEAQQSLLKQQEQEIAFPVSEGDSVPF